MSDVNLNGDGRYDAFLALSSRVGVGTASTFRTGQSQSQQDVKGSYVLTQNLGR